MIEDAMSGLDPDDTFDELQLLSFSKVIQPISKLENAN